jgi:hypothetical protein
MTVRKTRLTQTANERVPLSVTGVTPTLRNPLVPAVKTRRAGAHTRTKGGERAQRKRALAEVIWSERD